MHCRTVATWLALSLTAGGLSACATDTPDRPSTAAPSAIATANPSRAPGATETRAGTGTPGAAETPAGAGTPTRATAGSSPATPFRVATRTLRLSRGAARPLPTTIWYPATGTGPFPVIVFSHGLTSEPSAYATLLTRWARAGFVVAAPAFPHTRYGAPRFDALDVVNQPADASYVLTRVLALDTSAGDALAGRLDTGNVAAAGHSAGGITTIGMFTTSRDERLTAGLVLAGQQVLPAPFTGPRASILFVHGRLDRTVPYGNGLAAFEAVPWPKAMMSVTGGGHVEITKNLGPVLDTTTDFWRWSLYGDATARGRLHRDATAGGTATLIDKL